MVDLGSDDLKTRQNDEKLKAPRFYRGGEEVEVTSNEDGFGGAWYAATVVHFPKSAYLKNRRAQAVVQYKTLVTDDGSAHLIESVDPALIRPLPPPHSPQDFKEVEVNDVVDVSYRDGWWTGTVTRVLENSRFRVYFDNPPDVIDFDGKDLRPHLDWIDFEWVRPVVKQRTTGSVFSSGTPVEVNIDKGNVPDIWYPAIVIKENVEDNTFLVKYDDSENGDNSETVRVTVGPSRIRPTPHYVDRNYELLEKVDARYGFGWRSGTVTKLYEGRRYSVFFKHGNECREVDYSEIRPHLEWVDGEWISKTKAMNAPDHQEHLGEAFEGSDYSKVVLQLESLAASEGNTKDEAPSSTSLGNIMEQSTDYSESAPSKKTKLAASCDHDMPSRAFKMLIGGDILDVPLLAQLKKMPVEKTAKQRIRAITPTTGVKETKSSRKPALGDLLSAKAENLPVGKIVVTRKGRLIKSPLRGSPARTIVKKINMVDVATPKTNGCEVILKEAEIPLIFGLQAKEIRKTRSKDVNKLPDERLKLMRDQIEILNNSAGEMEFNSQISGRSNQKRKRGRPSKLALTSPTASEADKDQGSGEIPNEMVVKDQTADLVEPSTCNVVDPAATDKTGEALETGCKIKEFDMAIAVAPRNVTDDDQPLSILFGGMHSSAGELRISSGRSANVRNETKERSVDEAVNSSPNVACNSTPVKDLCVPFVRRSPVWKTIESMEAFQISPQQPHFHPLAECKEEYREGSAIGYMVTFTSLFEKASSLQFEDPISKFESTLESLLDLEKHGFDVTVLQGRVNELLSIKEKQEELVSQSKDAEREMREHMDGKQKLQEKITDIEKKIAELREELAASNLEMEAKDLEIARMRSHLDLVSSSIENASLEFENVATAPWKSP